MLRGIYTDNNLSRFYFRIFNYIRVIDNTIFSIENEGPEISPEQLSRLFDRFYRTDASRQRTEEGTGLGLAITKSILDMLGATIQAESLNGRIIFTIVFQSESMQGESF